MILFIKTLFELKRVTRKILRRYGIINESKRDNLYGRARS